MKSVHCSIDGGGGGERERERYIEEEKREYLQHGRMSTAIGPDQSSTGHCPILSDLQITVLHLTRHFTVHGHLASLDKNLLCDHG